MVIKNLLKNIIIKNIINIKDKIKKLKKVLLSKDYQIWIQEI